MRISILLFFVLNAISSIEPNRRSNDRTSRLKDNAREYHAYHVSVDGNDSNAGTKSRPLKTISAAANLESSMQCGHGKMLVQPMHFLVR